jgi:hypothetical protein
MKPSAPPDPPGLELAVERLSRRVAARWTVPIGAERFTGLPSMEDRPLYLAARAVLRRTGKIRVRTWVQRMVVRPDGMDSQMEQKVPQFFLRNTLRAERVVEDELPLEVVATRDREAERQLAELRTLRYRPPELLQRWNIDHVTWLRAFLKQILFDEDWRRRFGRELKETVQGPLFKYDPDRTDR